MLLGGQVIILLHGCLLLLWYMKPTIVPVSSILSLFEQVSGFLFNYPDLTHNDFLFLLFIFFPFCLIILIFFKFLCIFFQQKHLFLKIGFGVINDKSPLLLNEPKLIIIFLNAIQYPVLGPIFIFNVTHNNVKADSQGNRQYQNLILIDFGSRDANLYTQITQD